MDTLSRNSLKTPKLEAITESLVEEDTPVSFEEHPLSWKKFDEETISILQKLTPPELESKLANMLGFEDYQVSLADGAKLDYFVGGFLFSHEQSFTNFQTSCFMGLLNIVLKNCESNVTLEDNITEFVSYFSGISKKNENKLSGMERFNIEQAKKIINFVHQGIFQHYQLYQHLFQNEQKLEAFGKMLEIEVIPFGDVPFPPPLHEAMPLDLYETYVAPPPPVLDEITESEEMGAAVSDDINGNGAEEGAPARQTSEKLNTAEMILKSLNPEEIKEIVAKITEETLQNIKVEADTKIKEKEAVMVSKLNKLHLT